jgi:hypothetical protein
MKLRPVLCGICLLVVVGTGVRGDDSVSYRDNLNGGFFLLHDLLNDEHDVPILLDLKTAPQEIQDFAKKVSLTAEEGKVALDKMRDSDPKISFDKNPLPQIEQDVRASIKGEKQHQLLFGTKDSNFVRAFLVSQAVASMYASNIAKVMAQEDKNPRHTREFSHISERWHALYEEDFRLLRNY